MTETVPRPLGCYYDCKSFSFASPFKFDDLPKPYHVNVNTGEAPYDRRPGDAPALGDAEVDDIVAFLLTLSDGYRR